ncbi:MAG: 2Fe-2S iron-sulfur cluster binding domain-containing protein [Planctomycetes bacterium]|nr:2Fe-2S iron-sulfur cluster binding domain-containing protein [Planctomycetota bacterium]
MVYLWAILAFGGLVVLLSLVLIIAEKVLINYGICKLDINVGEKPLEVDGGQTLLQSLFANQIFIPSACGGKGSCGHCKIVVTEGGGPLLPTETPYLTRKEQKSNVRLACQVKVREDIYVRIPSDLLSVKMFTSTVSISETMTYDIKLIRLKIDGDEKISQRPGQYIQIQAPSPDGPVFRAYSISSPTYEDDSVEMMVRLVPGGIGSTFLHELNVGDEVIFTGPYGEFYLNDDPETEIICVGGGCGLAPMKNIIFSIYDKWPDRSCWLFFGCRGTGDIFYLKEFKELAKKHPNLHVVYALSEPEEGADWSGETGFVHLPVDKMLEPDLERQAFLCGPPLMIEAVTRVLEDKGIASDDIFYDKF